MQWEALELYRIACSYRLLIELKRVGHIVICLKKFYIQDDDYKVGSKIPAKEVRSIYSTTLNMLTIILTVIHIVRYSSLR